MVEAFNAFVRSEEDLATAQEMLSDPDMKAMAEEEIKASRGKIEELEGALQLLLLPRDPNDGSLFLEIRAGTGGDERAVPGDLLRMYTRYAEQRGWRVELMSGKPVRAGGYKEVIARIDGDGAYGRLKFESGAHRVQRVPATEAQGRIHTSAARWPSWPRPTRCPRSSSTPATCASTPSAPAGGQHINKTDSAVRITHLPTGLVVECQDDRSQHRNKDKAMQVLAARLKDKETRERQSKEAAERKSLIGSGDRPSASAPTTSRRAA